MELELGTLTSPSGKLDIIPRALKISLSFSSLDFVHLGAPSFSALPVGVISAEASVGKNKGSCKWIVG